jgi:hypothetical protein
VPRWSQYNAPSPGTIVNITTEKDVAALACLSVSLRLTGLPN